MKLLGVSFGFFWKEPDVFEVLFCIVQMIIGWLVMANQRLILTFVYAKCAYNERRALCTDLEYKQMNHCPWMMLGDFKLFVWILKDLAIS